MTNLTLNTNSRPRAAGVEDETWDDVRPAGSVYELLSRVWSRDGDRIALTLVPTGNPDDGDVRLTRRQLLELVNRAANHLAAIGIGPDDSVATLLPSGIESLAITYAAQAAGMAAPLNPLLRTTELEHLIRLSGARVLVASSDPGLGIWEKAVELAKRMPNLRLFAVGPPVPEAEDFMAAMAEFDGGALTFNRRIEPSDIAALIHTGGTTGMPKLARITHDNFLYGAWAQARCWNFRDDDVILSALPLFHVSGLATLATVPLSSGAEVLFLSHTGFRNPDIVANFWRIVEKYRGSFSAFVPTIANALASVAVGGADISSLKTVMIGGAAAPVETLRRLRAQVPALIVTTFGQTECLVGTGTRPGQIHDPLSSGGVLPFMEIAIRSEGGKDVSPGEPGQILLRGPAVFSGYVGQSTNEGFTNDGFLTTGDLGWLDDAGSLYVTGRLKDLIIRGGHNIDPRTIEEAGAAHPLVASCAAVGAPDRHAGEVPVLYATLVQDATLSPEDLIAWISARVPERPATPRHVHILPALPVTAVGKVFKPALRLDAATRVARQELASLLQDGSVRQANARFDQKRGMIIDIEIAEDQSAEVVQTKAEALLAGFLLYPMVFPAPRAA